MSKDYLKEIERYNVRVEKINPRQCALLVIDMQNYFDSIAREIKKNLLRIIDTCRANQVRIVFTRHGHKDVSKDGGMLAKWWGDNIIYGSGPWQIMPEFQPQKEDLIIDKNRYNAFFNTDLDKRLRAEGIEAMIITGVMTNCCCETTARDGFVRDFRIFFVSDATAAVNDDLHLSTLKNLAYGFAHIVNTEDVCKQLNV
jgi:isochorismate hydrolase